MASTPAQARSQSDGFRISPSMNVIRSSTSARLSREPVLRLSMTVTRRPSSSSRRTICEPMNPAPPVTRQVVDVVVMNSGSCACRLAMPVRQRPRIGGERDVRVGLHQAVEWPALEHLHMRTRPGRDIAAVFLDAYAGIQPVEAGRHVHLQRELQFERAATRQGHFTVILSLIHISEPTRL